MDPKTNLKPNVTQAVPFFNVTDMAASLRFYVDGLGFESDTDVPEETRLSEWRTQVRPKDSRALRAVVRRARPQRSRPPFSRLDRRSDRGQQRPLGKEGPETPVACAPTVGEADRH